MDGVSSSTSLASDTAGSPTCWVAVAVLRAVLPAPGAALGTPSTADGCCSKGSSVSGECLVSLSSCLVTGAGHCPRSSLTLAGSVSGCSTAGSAATGSGECTGHGSVQSGLSVPELDELVEGGEEGEVTSTITSSNSSASAGVRWAAARRRALPRSTRRACFSGLRVPRWFRGRRLGMGRSVAAAFPWPWVLLLPFP